MGWLVDLAAQIGLGDSYLGIAKAMEKLPSWPASPKRKVRYIGNKIGDLDQDRDLRWWQGTGRPFLRCLAEVLHESEADLEAALAQRESVGIWKIILPVNGLLFHELS